MAGRQYVLSDARGGNSVVECDLAKVDVVGSNPIRRSIRLRIHGVKDEMLRRILYAIAIML